MDHCTAAAESACLASVAAQPPPPLDYCSASDQKPGVATGTYCVCAEMHEGTIAQLEDWLRQQRCHGAAFIALRMARRLIDRLENASLSALSSWEQSEFVSFLSGSEAGGTLVGGAVFDEQSHHVQLANGNTQGILTAEGLIVQSKRRPPQIQAACRAALPASCDWTAHLEAPFEHLVGASALSTVPTEASTLRVGLVDFRTPIPAPAERPPRPLPVRATLRAEQWGACVLADGRLCAALRDTVLLERRACGVQSFEASSDPSSLPLLYLPQPHAAGLRVHRHSLGPPAPGQGSIEDQSGRVAQDHCDAAGDAMGPVPPPTRDALPPRDEEPLAKEGDSPSKWADSVAWSVAHGDGIAFLRGAVHAKDAAQLRRQIWSSLPPDKRSTRVFANHLCQIHKGVPESPGLDPECEPVAPGLMELASHPRVVAVAKRLLGDNFHLHNAGLSLVSAPPALPLGATGGAPHAIHAFRDSSPLAAASTPHQDQPIASAGVWGGRVPPPSHPLSLQALWLLDNFTFENGATYVLPRTQQRPEHIDNSPGGAMRAADGRLPIRFAVGAGGDVLLALGSLWHGPSSSHVGEQPRLALLFEYSPGFVEPRDRYATAMVHRHVHRTEQRRLFPLWEEACAYSVRGAAHTGAPRDHSGRGPSASLTGACAAMGLVRSVYEWPRLVSEHPECLSLQSRVILRNGGLALPVFGLGTGSPNDDPAVLAAAITHGHRLIDTGELYENERIIRQAIAASGVHPEALILSTKAGTWCTGALPPHIAAQVPAEYRRPYLTLPYLP